MSTLHPDLDLQGRIRPGLDILANEIVIALKKRTRFRVNEAVYQPGLLRGDDRQSLLMYTLGKIEHSHAELGRYTYAEQDAFTNVHGIESVIARTAPQSPLRQMPSGVGDRIVDFYRRWIGDACEPGDDSSTYGETVTADAVALLAIMERVNLGKLVAESKFLELQPQFIETGGDREAMLALIVRRDREVKVLELAERLAEHYQLPPQHAVSVFEIMIATTIDIEVDYLRLRIAEAGVTE